LNEKYILGLAPTGETDPGFFGQGYF